MAPQPAPLAGIVIAAPIPVGTRIRKVNSLAIHAIRDGHLGRVEAVHPATAQLQASREAAHGVPCAYGYQVAWDGVDGDSFVLGIRIEVAEQVGEHVEKRRRAAITPAESEEPISLS